MAQEKEKKYIFEGYLLIFSALLIIGILVLFLFNKPTLFTSSVSLFSGISFLIFLLAFICGIVCLAKQKEFFHGSLIIILSIAIPLTFSYGSNFYIEKNIMEQNKNNNKASRQIFQD